MGSADNFCLRWNDFETNISSSFRDLRQSSELFDVTLCCDNGSDTLRAHKVILAACSPLFRRILAHNQHHNPFLYLKGIQMRELQNVLNFMYHGEVNVAQESLNKFLAVAEELAVKGLTTNETVDTRVPPTYYDHDEDPEDAPLPTKRHSTVKKAKRSHMSSSSLSKRKVDPDILDSSLEVDIKRIKADPDDDDGGDNGELFEGGDDYQGIGGFDDDNADFDDSGAGASAAGTSAENKGRYWPKSSFLNNIVKKDQILQSLPLTNHPDFEQLFARKENRNHLSEYIKATVPGSDDFASQVFNKILTKELMAKYTWPAKRGNNHKNVHQQFPDTFIRWYECLVSEVLQPLYWFNPTDHMKKLRKFLTNVRYIVQKVGNESSNGANQIAADTADTSATSVNLKHPDESATKPDQDHFYPEREDEDEFPDASSYNPDEELDRPTTEQPQPTV